MKCEIKWLGEDGKPTPDENEAIGLVWTVAHESIVAGRKVFFEQSKRFPICAKHLEQFVRDRLHKHHWKFELLERP